jgi:hypothetical protein
MSSVFLNLVNYGESYVDLHSISVASKISSSYFNSKTQYSIQLMINNNKETATFDDKSDAENALRQIVNHFNKD